MQAHPCICKRTPREAELLKVSQPPVPAAPVRQVTPQKWVQCSRCQKWRKVSCVAAQSVMRKRAGCFWNMLPGILQALPSLLTRM